MPSTLDSSVPLPLIIIDDVVISSSAKVLDIQQIEAIAVIVEDQFHWFVLRQYWLPASKLYFQL